MSPVRRELIVDVSFVVVGTANAIRGIAVGQVGLAISGLVLLALVLSELAYGPVVGRLLYRVLGRAPGPWTRRVFLAWVAVAVVSDLVRCVASATRHDWGDCVFYGVRGTAGLGVLVGVATWSVSDKRAEPLPDAFPSHLS